MLLIGVDPAAADLEFRHPADGLSASLSSDLPKPVGQMNGTKTVSGRIVRNTAGEGGRARRFEARLAAVDETMRFASGMDLRIRLRRGLQAAASSCLRTRLVVREKHGPSSGTTGIVRRVTSADRRARG